MITPDRTYWLFIPALLLLQSGCMTDRGIRKLGDAEKTYFESLGKELEASQGKMKDLLDKSALNEEQASREVALFNNKIRNAKLIYSIREVLTAPKDDSTGFIQLTRNKVVLYHLAEAAQAENEVVQAQLTLAQERRKTLLSQHAQLGEKTQQLLRSQKAINEYLNEELPQQLAYVLDEVHSQVSAFNEEIVKADQKNPVIQRLVEQSKQAEEKVEKADEALVKFIGIWGQSNKPKDPSGKPKEP